jgi:hypothetical protein
VLTVVISGVIAPAVAAALETVVVARGCAETLAGGGVTASVDDAAPFNKLLDILLESLGAAVRFAGLAGGNSSWDAAMTMSERNKAKKKRLSIQGTGS